MVSKVKITFVVHESLQKELRERIINEDYGLRGKSKWVVEAIKMLLSMKNFPELVKFGNELSGFEKVETIVVDTGLKNQLNNAIIEIRKEFPALEGVQSRIVRTAILQRLIRK